MRIKNKNCQSPLPIFQSLCICHVFWTCFFNISCNKNVAIRALPLVIFHLWTAKGLSGAPYIKEKKKSKDKCNILKKYINNLILWENTFKHNNKVSVNLFSFVYTNKVLRLVFKQEILRTGKQIVFIIIINNPILTECCNIMRFCAEET